MKRVFGTALTFLTAVTASLIFSTFAYASCGKIKIAEMNWASAELMANVDKIILEKGYGCEVEMVAGATMPTFTSMDEGLPNTLVFQLVSHVKFFFQEILYLIHYLTSSI